MSGEKHIDVLPVAVAIGGLAAMSAAMGIGRFAYTPILPYMLEAGALDKSEAGWAASANFFGYLVGSIFATLRVLPGGLRRWFLISLFVSAISTAAMGLTADIAAFLALRFAGGVASAFVLVLASALVIERLVIAERQNLVSLHFAGVGIGISISALLPWLLNGSAAGWPVLWFAGGAYSLAAFFVAIRLVPRRGDRAPPRPAGKARTNPGLIRLILAYGLMGFGYVITATFISTIARMTPSLSEWETAIWLAAGLVGIPSIAVWFAVANRIGHRQAYTLAGIAQGAGVALSVLSTSPAMLILSAALLGGTVIAMTAMGLVVARQLTGGDQRRIIAWMTVSFSIGQMIGPAFAGHIFESTGSLVLPSLAAAGALGVATMLSGWPTKIDADVSRRV